MPAITDLGLYDCAVARDSASKTTAQYANTQPDIGTIFNALTGDCDGKVLTYGYTSLGKSAADINPEAKELAQLRFTGDTCGNPALRRLIVRGWRVEAVYAFASGEPLVMTAEC